MISKIAIPHFLWVVVITSKPKIVYSDFDGTLTDHNRMSPIFFEILDLCKSKKLPFVIVTGRSLSWAHFLMTHFDLPCVSAEGGGVWVEKNQGRFHERVLVDMSEVHRLEAFCEKLAQTFPNIPLTLDSFGRKTDRAIELYELDDEFLLREIQLLMNEEKINYSTSNVHLNFWAGEISKANMIHKYNQAHYYNPDDLVFFGDSLNDETVFQEFPHTVGVSNISMVIDRIKHRPKVILKGEEQAGPAGVLSYLKSLF